MAKDKKKLIVRQKAEIKIKIAMETMGDLEVNWFGKIKKKDNKFFLEDIYLPPQENSPGFTTTDDEKYPSWFFETFIKRKIQNKIRLHGHTHPTFATFSSGTDTKQFKKLLSEVDDYFIQMILSNRDTPYIRLWTKKDKNKAVIEEVEIIWEYTEKFSRIVKSMTNPYEAAKEQISIFDEFDRLKELDDYGYPET